MYRRKKTYLNHTRLYAIVSLVVLVLAAITTLQLTHTIHLFNREAKEQVATTGNSYTKGISGNSAQSQTGNTQSASAADNSTKNPAEGSTSTTLIAPSGTFANVYRAHLSDQMGSTCNTSPGATCQIFFTNGTVTKSLPLKTSDQGGAVYWAWKPSDSDVNLTPGTWQITAKATLGSQVQTASNGTLALTIVQ